jgi:hypothetical protein
MLPTNADIHHQLQVVEARLRQLECTRTGRGRAAALAQLRREREMLTVALLNRRVEAAKRVVDLARWRTANGALMPAGEGRRAEAALAG